MTTTQQPPPQIKQLNRILGLPALIFFGLAYMVPLTVFTTYGVVTEETSGHLPMAYVLTLIAMLFTAFSYGRMVREFPDAGSAYTYTRRSFGNGIGFMVGWTLLLDYLFLPMINYMVIGIYMKEYFPDVPEAVWILGAISSVTLFNIIGIKIVAKMNFLIIAFQLIFIGVFIAISTTALSSGETPSLIAPFFTEDMNWSSIISGAAILCLSFLGFDAVSTLSEETKDPAKNIPRAIMLCALVGGAIFIVVSYFGHLVFPDWQNFGSADSAAIDVMSRIGGTFLVTFFTASYIAGCFASALASQTSVSRILYVMGRDKVLPKHIFAKVSQRFHTPIGATIVVGAVSMLALTISLGTAASMISFGALIAFSFVNLSVVKHFIINKKQYDPVNLFRHGIVPSVGFLLTLWLWSGLSTETFEVGFAWAAAGFLYMLYLTKFFNQPVPGLHLENG